MQYVIKLGAYGLAGVAAFAVAVALMVSVSSTPTAEAVTSINTDGTPGEAITTSVPGVTKVYTSAVSSALVTFSISASSNASGEFTHANASDDGQVHCV